MADILFPQDTSAKATPTTSDLILLADVADSNNPKDATLWSLPISTATQTALNGKQDALVSGTNIKTVNGNSLLGSGDITISGWGSVATDAIWDAKGDLAGGTGANTASRLAVGSNGQVLTADSAEATGMKWANPAWGGDALTSSPLSQFASTTSAQLAGVISDETGSGVLVFWTDPTFTTRINVPEIKATSSSWVDVHNNSGTQVALFGAGWSTGSTLVGTTNVWSASADYHQIAWGTWTITDTATGSSSDININLIPKGTGRLQAGGVNVPTISSTDTLTNKDISSATNTYRSASDTTTGAVELATAAETTTGTDATRSVTPDGLAGSEFGKRTVSVLLSGSASGDSALATGDGLAAVPVDTTLNGMNLVAIKAYVSTVSSSGAPLFQVRRSRRSSATARTTVDMLSTGVSIDANEFESADATTAAVINTSNDDVQTGDILLFDCDTAWTGTKGAQILLTFQLP